MSVNRYRNKTVKFDMDEFKEQRRMQHVKCVFCRKPVELLTDSVNDALELEEKLLKDGGHVTISFGYGSLLDCIYATGFVHDQCFKDNVHLFKNVHDGLNNKEAQNGEDFDFESG